MLLLNDHAKADIIIYVGFLSDPINPTIAPYSSVASPPNTGIYGRTVPISNTTYASSSSSSLGYANSSLGRTNYDYDDYHRYNGHDTAGSSSSPPLSFGSGAKPPAPPLRRLHITVQSTPQTARPAPRPTSRRPATWEITRATKARARAATRLRLVPRHGRHRVLTAHSVTPPPTLRANRRIHRHRIHLRPTARRPHPPILRRPPQLAPRRPIRPR